MWQAQSGLNWRAAILLGLPSSTFSMAVSQVTATRIDQIEPSATVVAAGILFHQWATFLWEVTAFGLFER